LQFYLTLSLLVVGYAVGSCIYHATISDDLSLECLFFFLICGCAFIKKHWPLWVFDFQLFVSCWKAS
jgi:uncharacterized membrane protein YoaK (UPF0700 family)